MKKIYILSLLFLIFSLKINGYTLILIPMDETQFNHLKAYGMAYKALMLNIKVKWLLNYRGGSFLILDNNKTLLEFAKTRNISFDIISDTEYSKIMQVIEQENMNSVNLDSAPRVAIYAPPWNAPWDDAVTLALQYAEIPYTSIWDEEVLKGLLTTENFDWLHLHHEDFTGQHGKFWFGYGNEPWYIERVALFERMALKMGYNSIQEEKKAVALKIKEFVLNGGFLFAMCAATDSLDIALASIGIDIIPKEIDGTPFDTDLNSKLNYNDCLAFENFKLITSPYVYEFSDIDIDPVAENIYYKPFYFVLNEFSAKYDVIPTMLIQNHCNRIKGFLGQTTAFNKKLLKKDVTILAEIESKNYAFYIHGDRGKGTFTFYGGHDPEDYAHKVGDPPTNLDLFPNSPGYRLILNNILFPAAKEKKKKT